MTIADKARALAVNFEAKKDSLAQRQSGEWKLSFTVKAEDVPTELLKAPMGTRYVLALVEIGDDELPVEKPKDNPHKLSQQAAMLCEDARFQAWLQDKFKSAWLTYPAHTRPVDVAASIIRSKLAVLSRSELDTNPEAAARWRDLYAEYQAWLRT